MSRISEFSPDGGLTSYELKDKFAQPTVLETPLEIDGEIYTTVEGALSALNDRQGGGGTDLRGTDTYDIMLVTDSEFEE